MRVNRYCGCVFFLICVLSQFESVTLAQSVFINELMAINDAIISDEDGDNSDWIELYNAGPSAVDLSTYFLTDDPDDPQKWQFPAISIPENCFLVIWASGKDRKDADSELHLNFKLDGDGEYAGLMDSQGFIVDSVSWGQQEADVSLGRFPDGEKNLIPLQTPTPGEPNRAFSEIFASISQGFYTAPVTVTLSRSSETGVIRYSDDGGIPGPESNPYENPISVDRTTVIRAQVFVEGRPASDLLTLFYGIDETHTLPVISLVTDPSNLWDSQTGIYENWSQSGDAWERPANVSLLEDGSTAFQLDTGIRIHGQTSREKEKKSFRLYFRNEYGESRLEYPVFEDYPITDFKRLILYAPASDHPRGNAYYTLISDILTHALFAEIGGIYSAFRPVSLYLNGDYWGIFWIREHITRHFLESHFGIEEADLLRAEWRQYDLVEREGDSEAWYETFAYIESNNFSYQAPFDYFANTYVDVENFTDYTMMNIFANNRDWPQKNIDWFRDREDPESRWRWILWDTDVCWRFDPAMKTLEWATRDQVRSDLKSNDNTGLLWSTLMLRKLLSNQTYRNDFINRFADLMNTTLSTGNLHAVMTRLCDSIADEMPRELDRWFRPGDRFWEENLKLMRTFVQNRTWNQRAQIVDYFGLAGEYTLRILPPEGQGVVQINTIIPEVLPWEGVYFKNHPVPVKAIASQGFRFAGWATSGLPDTSAFELRAGGNIEIQALFEAFEKPPIVVGETQVTVDSRHTATVRWTTDRETRGCIEYGTTPAFGLWSSLEDEFRTTHEVRLSDLLPETQYHFRIWNVDVDNDSTVTDGQTLTTPEALKIRDINVLDVTRHGARVTWSTNTETVGRVEFGPDSTLGFVTACESSPDTSHCLLLSDLQPGMIVHFRIKSRSADGDSCFSPVLRFSTRNPLLIEVSLVSAGRHTLRVAWTSSDSTRGQIEYGENGSFESVLTDTTWALAHEKTISGLNDSTCYSVRIRCSDRHDQEILSADTLFWTRADHEAPRILSSSVDSVGITGARIAWQTDEITHGEVLFGLTRRPDTQSASSADSSRNHAVRLTSLLDSTMYYFQIISRDLFDNRTVSLVDSFRTKADTTVSSVADRTWIPRAFSVTPNYPNPFNMETTFSVHIPQDGELFVQVFNIYGQIVNDLYDGAVDAGVHDLHWRGHNRGGGDCSTGLYLCQVLYTKNRASSDCEKLTMRIILQK